MPKIDPSQEKERQASLKSLLMGQQCRKSPGSQSRASRAYTTESSRVQSPRTLFAETCDNSSLPSSISSTCKECTTLETHCIPGMRTSRTSREEPKLLSMKVPSELVVQGGVSLDYQVLKNSLLERLSCHQLEQSGEGQSPFPLEEPDNLLPSQQLVGREAPQTFNGQGMKRMLKERLHTSQLPEFESTSLTMKKMRMMEKSNPLQRRPSLTSHSAIGLLERLSKKPYSHRDTSSSAGRLRTTNMTWSRPSIVSREVGETLSGPGSFGNQSLGMSVY